MILYVILFFIALCIGMASSVYAFGTGGKRKKIFEDIYFSVEEVDGIGVVYTKNGDYSAILRMENPVQKYSANIDSYYEFTQNIPCKSHLFFYNTTYMGCLRRFSLHDKNVALAKIEIRELHLQRLYSLQ